MATTLMFSNVPAECSEECLSQWIEAHGYSVLTIKLIRDLVSGTSPSFAHVELANAPNLKEATRDLDGQTLQGTKMHVEHLFQAKTMKAAAAR